jgi:predicted peptidase
MRRLTLITVAMSILFMYGCSTIGRKSSYQPGQQVACEMTKKVEVGIGYQLFLPASYDQDTEKDWPMILFLHGAGERGDDLEMVKMHGPPKMVESDPDFKFVIVSPQCPKEQVWDIAVLNALLDEIIEKYNIDQDRVYLTGLSMGGYGTWNLSTFHADRFAAIAPICGGGQARMALWRLKGMPIWVFHGAKDGVVPISESKTMVETLKKVGEDVRFTIYPEAGHDSWTQAYNTPELFDWFLSHKRSDR